MPGKRNKKGRKNPKKGIAHPSLRQQKKFCNLKEARFARICISLDDSSDSFCGDAIQFGVMIRKPSDEGADIRACESQDLSDDRPVRSTADPSDGSGGLKGDQMPAKKTKQVKKSPVKKSVTPAPGTDKKDEFAFLDETAEKGAKIAEAIAAMDPALEKQEETKADALAAAQDKPKPKKSAKAKASKKAEPAPEAAPAKDDKAPKKAPKAAKPAPKAKKAADVAQPGTDKKEEFEFLQETGDDGAVIFSAIAAMDPALEKEAEDKADALVAKEDASAKPAAKEEAAPAETVAQPGVDKKEEFAFLDETGEKGAKIYEAVAEMDPALLKESEDKADALVAKEDAPASEKAEAPAEKKAKEPAEKPAAKEEAAPAETIAEPGVDKKDEFAFLDETAEKGAEIFEAVAEMDPALEKKAEEEADKANVSTIPVTKTEGKYSKVADKEKVMKETKKSLPAVSLTDEAYGLYRNFSNDTLLEMVQALGLEKDFAALSNEIVAAKDLEAYTADLVLQAIAADRGFTFDEDGYDISVIPVLVKRIADTLPFKASDQTDLSNAITEALNMNLSEDGMANADLYHRLFDHVRSILMRGQKQGAHTLAELQETDDADLRGLIEHFMNVAYDLLPYWQYDDVKYYEGFIYAVLSQFQDLADLHNRAMMDVADLYIKHGDYGRGDADYNYLLRENNLKDQIYYRFANVYRPIDLQKAKAIAGGALQTVDGRYQYYPQIIEILES